MTAVLNADDFEAARQSRDPRFDGRFFVGVLTTGIYCRPVCPVRIPRKENVRLYKSAASAAAAGFRPCLRCRPESSPGTPAWSGGSWKVSRALQLIEQGFLDDGSVVELAALLNIGPRQLSRLFHSHIGASPVEVAQTRRLHFAKKLIDETAMPLTEICFAAGFGSVRRFNAVFNNTYGRSPKQLRERQSLQSGDRNEITIGLSYRPPYDWRSLLAFLAYRAIPGVEVVTADSYTRTISLDGKCGHFLARIDPAHNQIQVAIGFEDTRYLYQIIDRVRSIFDLRADSVEIERHLGRDGLLTKIIRRNPGLRVPGCWDGLEVGVRAILGQQVTVKAASTLVSRVVGRLGSDYRCSIPALTHVFPSAGELAGGNLDDLGITGSRIAAIKELAAAVKQGKLKIDCGSDPESFSGEICRINGIGEWTAQYIAMRALNDPNAFPHSDLILRRAATGPGRTLTPKQLLLKAEPWQPWRAYGVVLLWKHYQRTRRKQPGPRRRQP